MVPWFERPIIYDVRPRAAARAPPSSPPPAQSWAPAPGRPACRALLACTRPRGPERRLNPPGAALRDAGGPPCPAGNLLRASAARLRPFLTPVDCRAVVFCSALSSPPRLAALLPACAAGARAAQRHHIHLGLARPADGEAFCASRCKPAGMKGSPACSGNGCAGAARDQLGPLQMTSSLERAAARCAMQRGRACPPPNHDGCLTFC